MAHTADMHTTHKHKSILQDTHATKDGSHYKVANRYELTIDEASDFSPIVYLCLILSTNVLHAFYISSKNLY
jgi:hypothetical protein